MTAQMVSRILIADDDEYICKTLATILQAEGYQTTTAFSAKDALEKARSMLFAVALLDIRLPDEEGTRLLAQLQKITPETIKIIITGYPSLKNAVEALNFGADSYIMKPINPVELLKTIRKKLEAKKQAETVTKEKLADWIQAQAQRMQSSGFQEFLEETASELADFGLTRTQAKIYIALVGLGVASVSEIANTSKIRREEVYRIIPELEKQGIVTRKLKVPRKYSTISPDMAIKLLTERKLQAMKDDIEKLKQKQQGLISSLKKIELPIDHNDCSIEVISQQDTAIAKMASMAMNAKSSIDVMASPRMIQIAYLSHPKKITDTVLKPVKVRIITEKREHDTFTKGVIHFSKENNSPIEVRQAKKLLYNLLLVDGKEAMWKEPRRQSPDAPIFWTDNPTQVTILEMSFENLWKQSTNIMTT
jgi:DNA-binding response OmpR family regulator